MFCFGGLCIVIKSSRATLIYKLSKPAEQFDLFNTLLMFEIHSDFLSDQAQHLNLLIFLGIFCESIEPYKMKKLGFLVSTWVFPIFFHVRSDSKFGMPVSKGHFTFVKTRN